MNPDEVETMVNDFRAWLSEAKEMPRPAEIPDLDIATIVQHFTALRHEVNLLTKSSRAQLEQNAQTLGALEQSLESLRGSQPEDADDDDALLRTVLKALIDAHDALAMAEREVRRALANYPTAAAPAAPAELKIRLPHWARWLGLDVAVESQLAAHRALRPPPIDPVAVQRQAFDALLVGYSMSMQRLERAITQQGLEPMQCAGKPFDPETMEVAEVVREEGRTGTIVLEEIRRGYLWHGRLFRYAQVRVAKP